MKKGLTRLWILGSVFWYAFPWFTDSEPFGVEMRTAHQAFSYYRLSQIIWWALLYIGFQVTRGFVDDDDKKAGFQ